MASSIESYGLVNPITVQTKPKEDGYIIVAGERRYRAFVHLKRQSIPAIVTSGNIDEISLIENVQRVDLSPIEEAEACVKMISNHGYTHEDLARIVGKSRATITKLLKLNKLPARVKKEFPQYAESVNRSMLAEIVSNPPELQLDLWDRVKKGGVTIRAARTPNPAVSSSSFVRIKPLIRAGKAFLKRLSELPSNEISPKLGSEYLELLQVYEEIIQRMQQIQLGEE